MRIYIRFSLLFLLLALAAATLYPPAAALGYEGERTYDTLSQEENAELERLSDICFAEVRKEALTLLQARFDVNTILRTFTEQIRVIRYRKRQLFLDVERYLYSLRLNPEFVDSYMRSLREDAVYYALDALIQKSRGRTQ